jgi:hypothetical protein
MGDKTQYQDSPCTQGQQQTLPLLPPPDAKSQAEVEKRLEKDHKRADAFMERTRHEQNKAAERRHELSIQDKKLETAKLRKEAAELERDAKNQAQNDPLIQPKRKRVFKAKIAKKNN